MVTEAEEVTAAADSAAQNTESATEIVVDPEVTASSGDKTVVTPAEGIEKLKKQLADSEAARVESEKRRIAAETAANDAARGEAAAKTDVQKTQLDLIKGAIDQATQQNDVLEQQYAAQAAAQDWAAAAKTQRKMAETAARLTQLESGKHALENAPKVAPRAPVDPVEKFCAQLTPASANWVRQHPTFVTDKRQYRLMIRAHEDALDAGLATDTPAYFRSLEMTLGLTSPGGTSSDVARTNGNGANGHATAADDATADTAAVAVGGRSAAPAAAPVSRSGNATGTRSNTVKLSPDQVEMAHAMFPDSKNPLEEYAKNLVALKKEGKLS
jgi:hypothetical protein